MEGEQNRKQHETMNVIIPRYKLIGDAPPDKLCRDALLPADRAGEMICGFWPRVSATMADERFAVTLLPDELTATGG